MTEFATRRLIMVDTQIRPNDVTKFPVIDAIARIPREHFLPADKREQAYISENIDLGRGRVMLEPRTIGKMLDLLNIQPDELVLDLGVGTGYSAAVIARLAEAVVAVEEDESMAADAQVALSEIEADNVILHTGQIAMGAPQHGPYDVIVAQGAVASLPAALEDQLKEGGRIALLFQDGPLGEMRLGIRHNGQISWRAAFNASAPVLPGFERPQVFAL